MNDIIETLKDELAQAKDAMAEAREAVAKAEADLRAALPDSTDPDDYRIVVSIDESLYFNTTRGMLDTVFGDFWCTCGDKCESSKYGECTPTDLAQSYIDAFEDGSGIFGHSARLEKRDPVSGEFEDEDSCGGFFSTDGFAPVDQIMDMLEPAGMNGQVLILGDDEV